MKFIGDVIVLHKAQVVSINEPPRAKSGFHRDWVEPGSLLQILERDTKRLVRLYESSDFDSQDATQHILGQFSDPIRIIADEQHGRLEFVAELFRFPHQEWAAGEFEGYSTAFVLRLVPCHGRVACVEAHVPNYTEIINGKTKQMWGRIVRWLYLENSCRLDISHGQIGTAIEIVSTEPSRDLPNPEPPLYYEPVSSIGH